MGGLSYAFADLYPTYGGVETSNIAIPEQYDQEAMNMDSKTAEETSNTNARSKNVFVAIGIIVAFVVLLGGVK